MRARTDDASAGRKYANDPSQPGVGPPPRSLGRLIARTAFAATLALACSGTWAVPSRADAGFGAFGGYQRYGPVRSLRAEWAVPRVSSGTPFQLASTWIGAQAPRPGRAFIQVGTEEGCGEGPCGEEGPQYFAFWSDAHHGYHPQRLFDVGPGDRISARLLRTSGSWQVAVADETRRVRARVSTSDETGSTFELAEWTQEDPVSAPGELAPYPALDGVRFSEVEVNGLRPSYNRLYSTWMSVNGVNLAPTPLEGGAFSLAPAPAVTPTAAAFLLACANADEMRFAFDDALTRWTSATPRAEIVAGAERYAAALVAERQTLGVANLTPSTLAQRRELFVALRALTSRVRAIGTTPSLTLGRWRRSVLLAEARASAANHIIRRALQVPEVVAPGLVLASAAG
ncbi:MAG TPA: hypothetical protein VFW29_03375 [Solirubrobacteraceae bacterium]|nr:hypothetical protein [Solirubrobacteraceae bacterium]